MSCCTILIISLCCMLLTLNVQVKILTRDKFGSLSPRKACCGRTALDSLLIHVKHWWNFKTFVPGQCFVFVAVGSLTCTRLYPWDFRFFVSYKGLDTEYATLRLTGVGRRLLPNRDSNQGWYLDFDHFCDLGRVNKYTQLQFNLVFEWSFYRKRLKHSGQLKQDSRVEAVVIASLTCLPVAGIGPSDLRPLLWERVTLVINQPLCQMSQT